MGRVVARVPPYPSAENREFHEVNPTCSYVVEAYAGALDAAGRTAEAEQQRKTLAELKGK